MSEQLEGRKRMIIDVGKSPDPDVLAAIVETGKSLGLEVVRGEIRACGVCLYFDCVCEIRRQHRDGCKFRAAATCPVGIACEHGVDVCPTCDPCTCKAVTT